MVQVLMFTIIFCGAIGCNSVSEGYSDYMERANSKDGLTKKERNAAKLKEAEDWIENATKILEETRRVDRCTEFFDAKAIYTVYDGNEVKGDLMFKGKEICIHGTVHSVNKDISDKAYLSLYGGKHGIARVNLTPLDTHAGKLVDFNKGDIVNARCVGSGTNLMFPAFEGCVF